MKTPPLLIGATILLWGWQSRLLVPALVMAAVLESHRLGLRGTVRTLVTMATPHQGTYAAQYANTTLTRSLRPASDVIRNLNAEDLTDYPMRFFSIFSNRDVYVVPAEGMTHPAAENVYLPDVSHSQYLVSPQVFRVVASCLAGRPESKQEGPRPMGAAPAAGC